MCLDGALVCARESRASRPCHATHMGESPMPLNPPIRRFSGSNRRPPYPLGDFFLEGRPSCRPKNFSNGGRHSGRHGGRPSRKAPERPRKGHSECGLDQGWKTGKKKAARHSTALGERRCRCYLPVLAEFTRLPMHGAWPPHTVRDARALSTIFNHYFWRDDLCVVRCVARNWKIFRTTRRSSLQKCEECEECEECEAAAQAAPLQCMNRLRHHLARARDGRAFVRGA